MKKLDYTFDNIGGLMAIYAIPPESFIRLRKDYILNTYNLELRQRDNIIAIPVLDNGTYNMGIEQENSLQGDAWRTTIDGFIPAVNKAQSSLLSVLQQRAWYVLAVDQNGCYHFCGEADTLMRFKRTFTSGDNAAARNATSFTFENLQAGYPVIIEDIII